MSTKFFNNTPDNSLFEKFKGIAHNMLDFHTFQAVVGYFRSSGYFKLREEFEHVKKIQILVGINIDNIFRKQSKLFFGQIDEQAVIDAYSHDFVEEVKNAGYDPGKDFMIAMDAASSEWKTGKLGEYKLPKAGTVYTSDELIDHWKRLVDKYPIISIEDALDEEDWEGWKKLTKELGDKVQLVGDDLFVTNTERLSKGISLGCGNSILIKLNQIGSVSETLEAIKMAHKAGYTAISSHRSGETEDTTIADLAVALNTCQIKTGAPSRTERVAKYNQLLRIEEELGDAAVYPGMSAFNVKR